MPDPIGTFRQIAAIVCVAAGIAVAGCAGPPVGATDYRLQYPIAAQEKVFSMFVPMSPSGHGLSAVQLHRVKLFADDYLRRGRGPFLVSQGSAAGAFGRNRARIADALVQAGVPEHAIYFKIRSRNDNVDGSTTELSYSGFTVRVPQCGDWSGQAGFDPTNRPHTNFGCSYQRNIGLILSNPGDLSVAGGSIERDAQTSDRVIRAYRAGKATGMPAPVLEQKDFSDPLRK